MTNEDVWSIIYQRAVDPDGKLYFKERLTKAFLSQALRTMGTYLFANQYQNEVIPDEARIFRKEWLKYYESLPQRKLTFAFIDPAIGQKKTHDYTAIVVVDVDTDHNWYVRVANRARLTPTQIVEKVFEIQAEFNCQCIGIEAVAYQRALLYMCAEEMRRRKVVVPVKDVTPGPDKSKEMRISGLQPKIEWGTVYLNRGLNDLELEMAQFPRGSHDDLIDALSQIDQVVVYPEVEKPDNKRPNPADASAYESWFLRNVLLKKANDSED